MNPLIQKIKSQNSSILLYGFTPPKKDNETKKIREISQRRMDRLKKTSIDGLVIYDIQDESSRLQMERPFPFLPTLEPMDYHNSYLNDLNVSPIYYQCVGNYTEEELIERMESLKAYPTVFVGSPSKDEQVKTSLKRAYELSKNRGLTLGGVVIPERHAAKGDEHLRLLHKQGLGCEFFISQCVFDVEKFKDMLASYYYHCKTHSLDIKPIIMTVSPCGSLKTMDLLRWLGISIPQWIELDLKHGGNTLENSMDLARTMVKDLMDYSRKKKIPLGCNVESVSIRKEEVLASFELVNDIRSIMDSLL